MKSYVLYIYKWSKELYLMIKWAFKKSYAGLMFCVLLGGSWPVVYTYLWSLSVHYFLGLLYWMLKIRIIVICLRMVMLECGTGQERGTRMPAVPSMIVMAEGHWWSGAGSVWLEDPIPTWHHASGIYDVSVVQRWGPWCPCQTLYRCFRRWLHPNGW
jgi:hypothetical protein